MVSEVSDTKKWETSLLTVKEAKSSVTHTLSQWLIFQIEKVHVVEMMY